MLRVNGQEIPQGAIDHELGRLLRFYAQHLPEEQIRQQMDALRERAKDQAIGAALLFAEAHRLDIVVSDAELAERMKQIVAQAGGEETFLAMLAKQNIPRAEFEEQVRRGRRVDKLVEKVTAGMPDPTESDIKAHYDAHQAEYVKGEQAQAQHILVSPANDSADAKLEAIGKINQLKEKLKGGADFGELAAGYSECPSGKQAGGSLGWFGRGAMVPEFDKAVFAMQDGEVSDIVETQFGFHLIKKTGHQPASTPSFDEAHEGIREFLRHARRGEALAAHVADLRKAATIETL